MFEKYVFFVERIDTMRLASTLTRLCIIGGIVAGASLTGTAASAALVTFNFTGTVDTVHTQLASQFSTSQTMSGQATVNTSGAGVYSIQGFNVNIGGYNATMGPSGAVTINDVTSGHDQFLLQVVQPNGVPVNSLNPSLFEIDLKGSSSVFSNNALPSTPPSLSSFTNLNSWRLVFSPGIGRAVSGTVASLTAVPLPAAVILFGAGLVALAGLGAGGWRQWRNSLQQRNGLV
jgi:hypothetical protein